MRCCLSLTSLTTILFAAIGGEHWPQFRGPTGDGMADCRNLPITWSEKENVVWKTAIHGKGWSSPVIWGDQIWLTTAPEDGKESYAVCIDRISGKIIHDIKLYTTENPAFCHPYNSYASCTPVIEAGRVYIHFGSVGTACLDTSTGHVLWERRDLPCDHWRGPGSSPILHENLLILTFDGYDQQYITALDKNTGKTVWKTDRQIDYGTDNGDLKKAYSTPAVLKENGRALIVSPSAAATIAYDADTGKEVWRVQHGGMNEAARPIFAHGLVFLTSGHTQQLLAIRLGGQGDLTRNIAWATSKGLGPSRPSVLVVGDNLFFVSDNGIASCSEAKTGKRLWQERLGGAFSASPICAEGRIYFAGEDGKTHVIAAEPTYQSLAVNKLDAGCMASPAAAGDGLFLRTKTHLYRLGKK